MTLLCPSFFVKCMWVFALVARHMIPSNEHVIIITVQMSAWYQSNHSSKCVDMMKFIMLPRFTTSIYYNLAHF